MSVRNILLLSQLGVETGGALADILLGKANPSGKLTTTWAAFEEYPEMPDFEDMNETRYREGIYVGYRYFDTFRKKLCSPLDTGFPTQSSALGLPGWRRTVRRSLCVPPWKTPALWRGGRSCRST